MKPFLFGKKSVDSPLLRVAHNHLSTAAPGASQPPHNGPSVEVVKQGDKIVRLLVTCSCGEKIEVECLYPAGK
jgi:hypothetical protein